MFVMTTICLCCGSDQTSVRPTTTGVLVSCDACNSVVHIRAERHKNDRFDQKKPKKKSSFSKTKPLLKKPKEMMNCLA